MIAPGYSHPLTRGMVPCVSRSPPQAKQRKPSKNNPSLPHSGVAAATNLRSDPLICGSAARALGWQVLVQELKSTSFMVAGEMV